MRKVSSGPVKGDCDEALHDNNRNEEGQGIGYGGKWLFVSCRCHKWTPYQKPEDVYIGIQEVGQNPSLEGI